MGADNGRRVVTLAGRGDAATAGDVAAGAGRGVGGARRLSVCLSDPPDPRPSISVRLRGGTGAPVRAPRSVLPQLGRQLTEAGLADVALIVSELVTNSVLHANVGPDQTLTVECDALPDRLRITVTDPGSRLEPRLRSPDKNAPGGYGLAIVTALSLAWGVVRNSVGTTSVWCELPLDTSRLRLSTDRDCRTVGGDGRPERPRHRTSPEHGAR
jgi:anti-sigma regulatory factor (Ser/Thr protein kinase)